MNKLQRVIALGCLLALLCLASGLCLAENQPERFVYGYSELGRELLCYTAGNREAELSLLMIFGIHGFEDAFDRDGDVLGMIAERIIAHYAPRTELPMCLYVVPCANPDGLLQGDSQNGFGRCNANGIDINRDFSVDWSKDFSSRNKTGRTPFATAEARAIRDLVEQISPDYAMDIHGWCELSFGNGKMANIFAEPFGFDVRRLCGGGMACAWLNAHTQEGMLLELPPDPDRENYVMETAEKLIMGIDAWIAHCNKAN